LSPFIRIRMSNHFPFYTLSDDESEDWNARDESQPAGGEQYPVPFSSFMWPLNPPSGPPRVPTQHERGFSFQSQASPTPPVLASVQVYDSSWGTPASSQSSFTPVYHQYTAPSTLQPLPGTEWAQLEYRTANQFISQVRINVPPSFVDG